MCVMDLNVIRPYKSDLAELGVICVPSSLLALTHCGVESYPIGISSVGVQERCRYPVRVRSGARCKY